LGEGLVYCLILKENLNEFIFNGFTTQPRKGRGEKKMKRFKQCALTLALSHRVERGEKGREGNKKEFT
jgi:hypothetical protein